ncbi:hypothetical protein ACJIZ3_004190 [Penstemon smallii]|uniref:RING-type domain-containing protein n=1 Tax=Penstemon smallii TaxID=265156 RepID=A0ABD3S1G3_9LAMI
MEETITKFLIIFSSSILIFFTIPSHSANSCPPVSCHSTTGPIIRFPFRLSNRQPVRCGYPGFDLYCNNQNQTILNLRNSGEFIVDYIDYPSQALFINDPNSCLPSRIMNLSTLTDSPFRGVNRREYTFLNCSSTWMEYSSYRFTPLFCLSGRNYTVLGMNSYSPEVQVPATCRRIATMFVPVQWTFAMFYWSSSMDFRANFELVWREPACRNCENRGGVCGFRGDSGFEIGCSRPSRTGLPRSAKYGIIIGIGIPGLICIIGLISYACGMFKSHSLRRSPNSELPTTTISGQRLPLRSITGLDEPIIESYPKTVLGESCRLPKPSDATCPICLTDYQPKETLRSIPECNHYFHADCIDEWLKLNGTCPLCRNSPESLTVTPCSSMPLSSSS